ncbi:MAG TPA: type II toxin-antitoxin system Phd/YefM family antitoxin [Terracidiphilus sp.]|nr:type II toxin-antitoxin system Phd/YefM family antitoxin [Terracidiphilus sp.]
MRRIPAGEFKAKCLAVIDEVAATGEPVLVTKRGKPAAKLVPPDAVLKEETPESIFGALRGMIDPSSDLDSLVGPIIPEEDWDHLKEDWSPFPPEAQK